MHVNEALFFEYMSRCYRHVMYVCSFAEDVRLCKKKKKSSQGFITKESLMLVSSCPQNTLSWPSLWSVVLAEPY